MIAAHIDDNGALIAIYEQGVGVPPPESVDYGFLLEITPEQRDDWVADASQRWIDGSIKPYTPPPTTYIPHSISRFQARAALLAAERLADVEAAVAAADAFSQLAWAEAQEWRRDSQTLDALAKGIGLTDAEIDDLFIQAAAIRA